MSHYTKLRKIVNLQMNSRKSLIAVATNFGLKVFDAKNLELRHDFEDEEFFMKVILFFAVVEFLSF